MTVQDLFQRYLRQTRARRNKVSQTDSDYKTRVVLSALGKLGIQEVKDIDGETLPRLIELWEAKELSEHTVHAYARTYRAVMNWGRKQKIVSEEQIGQMELREPQSVRDRVLTKMEIAHLLSELEDHWLETPTALGIYQGLRRREVCNLKGADIDFEEGIITVRESKNKEVRDLCMHPALSQHLTPDAWNDDYVCKNASHEQLLPDWLTHKFSDFVHAIGPEWEDVCFHSLRHSCATHMAKSGNWNLLQLARFLGHKTTRTTERYAHLLSTQIQPSW